MQFHPVVAAIAVSTLAFPAIAQTLPVVAVVSPPPLDLTGIAIAGVGALLTIVGAVATAAINSRMKDKQAAATMTAALANAEGAMKQAIDGGLRSMDPRVQLPGLTGPMTVYLQYALDHAGAEFARAGITPAAIADKMNAKIGLVKLADPSSPLAVLPALPAPKPLVSDVK